MQSVTRRVLRLAALCAACLQATNAEVTRVPADVPTIQGAFAAISEGDTILVSDGVYPEALIAPTFGFVLIGDVEPDTGLYSRPVIDPSSLPNPTTLLCLDSLRGVVLIEKMRFRNDWRMYPRNYSDHGGVRCASANATLRDCVFDSTYRGIMAFQQDLTLERCVFVRSVRHCAYVIGSLFASDCVFEVVNNEWSAVLAGEQSLIERCNWHGGMGEWDWWLAVHGDGWIVRDCVFGPGGGSRQSLINLGGMAGRFENNVIADCQTQGTILSAGPACGGHLDVLNNHLFNNIIRGPAFVGSMGMYLTENYDENRDPCGTVHAAGNVIENSSGANITNGMSIVGDVTVDHNHFRNLAADTQWTVDVIGRPTFRENIFTNNLRSLRLTYPLNYTGNHFDARMNYWGHATGPFHPQLNPLGQGDQVGDSINFDPWYTDTLFFSATPEPHPPLPQTAQLSVYPNPFNANTTLEFTVPRAIIAKIELFDITGRRVRELFHGPAYDSKRISLNAADLPSGIFFARAWDTLGNRPLAITKLVLLK